MKFNVPLLSNKDDKMYCTVQIDKTIVHRHWYPQKSKLCILQQCHKNVCPWISLKPLYKSFPL